MMIVRRGETITPPEHEGARWGGGTFDLQAGDVFPRHRHDRHEEQIGVAEGEVRVTVGGTSIDLAAGDFVVVERGEPHEMLALTAARGWFLKFPYLPGDRVDLA